MTQEMEKGLSSRWWPYIQHFDDIRAKAKKEKPPGEATLWFGAVQTLRTQDRCFVEQAVEAVGESIPKDQILSISGTALFDAGFEEEGLKNLREAAVLNNSQENLRILASRFEDADKHVEALDIYEDILETDPNDPATLMGYAFPLASLRKWAEAEECIRKAGSHCSTDAGARFVRARALERQYKFSSAIKEYRKAIKYHYPETGVAWFGIAYCHLVLGKLRKAKKAIRWALTLSPQYELAKAILEEIEGGRIVGPDLFALGYYTQAYPLLKVEVKSENPPGLATLYLEVAESLKRKDAEPVKKAMQIIGDNLSRDLLLQVSGVTIFDLGEKQEGIAKMREAVRLNRSIHNMIILAACLSSSPQWKAEANILYEEVLLREPHEAYALCGLSANVEDEEPNKALELAVMARDANHEDAECHYRVGHCLMSLCRFEEAISEYRCALNLAKETCWSEERGLLTVGWAEIGNCYLNLGDLNKAGKYCQRALREDPSYDYAKEILEKVKQYQGDVVPPEKSGSSGDTLLNS